MAYEIITMSSFHAAAMMGHHDIILALLDKVSSISTKNINNSGQQRDKEQLNAINYFTLRKKI